MYIIHRIYKVYDYYPKIIIIVLSKILRSKDITLPMHAM